jgi:hypothetical protein
MRTKTNKVTNFYDLGLLYGDILAFTKDPSVKCKVISSSKVAYKGEEYSLSRLTNMLIAGDPDIQTPRYNGWDYWLFNNDLINNRRVLLKKHLAVQKLQNLKEND